MASSTAHVPAPTAPWLCGFLPGHYRCLTYSHQHCDHSPWNLPPCHSTPRLAGFPSGSLTDTQVTEEPSPSVSWTYGWSAWSLGNTHPQEDPGSEGTNAEEELHHGPAWDMKRITSPRHQAHQREEPERSRREQSQLLRLAGRCELNSLLTYERVL